jgi:hypothetical protein
MPLRLACWGSAAIMCLAVWLDWPGLHAREYEVSERVLNGKTGHPIPDIRVELTLIYEHPGPRGSTTEIMVGKTSRDGVATFRISDPLPKRLAIGGGDAQDLLPCSHTGALLTCEVLNHGVVAKNLCDKKGRLKGKFVARPGEVIDFVIPASWWRRLIPTK